MESSARWWTIPVLAVAVLTSIALIFFQTLSKTSPSKNSKPSSLISQPKSPVVLSFAPQLAPPKDKKIGLAVDISSETNKISAVELHLNFDPKAAQITDITPGAFFNNPFVLKKSIDNDKGEVVFVVGTLNPSSGSGAVAEVLVQALKEEAVKVSLAGSQVAAVGYSGNVLTEAKKGVFEVQ